MAQQPLLTIAIPTYNRPEQIQTQIRNILPQLNNEIILKVYDNSSELPVETLFTKDELSLFIIVRNRINIGGDLNIFKCFENCQTKWLWTLGDDDYIRVDAVETVLTYINKYSEAQWINFNHTCNCELKNISAFLSSINNHASYGDLFWISKCVYNISILSEYRYLQYKNISAMIGQVVPLIKYAIDQQNILYIRTNASVLNETTPGGWSIFEYLKYTPMAFDIFNKKERKILRGNFLKELFLTNLRNVNILFLDMNYSKVDVLYYFRLLLLRYGLLNAIKYGKKTFGRALISCMLPKYFLVKIKTYFTRLRSK